MGRALLLVKRHHHSHMNSADLRSTHVNSSGTLPRHRTSPSSAAARSTAALSVLLPWRMRTACDFWNKSYSSLPAASYPESAGPCIYVRARIKINDDRCLQEMLFR